MEAHLTVNGVPWCRCSHTHTSPALLDKMFSELGMSVMCMGNEDVTNEEALKFLNDNGIPAQLTDGVCPTMLEDLGPEGEKS
jgi:hypothetical protein